MKTSTITQTTQENLAITSVDENNYITLIQGQNIIRLERDKIKTLSIATLNLEIVIPNKLKDGNIS